MTEKTKAYMAGIMDGDRCFMVARGNHGSYVNYRPLICFTNGSRPLLEWAVKHFGGCLHRQKAHLSTNGYVSKELFHWRLYGRTSVRSFLASLIPYLMEKKQQAQLLLDYVNLEGRNVPSERETIYLRLREMKQSGCVTTDTLNDSKTSHAYLAGIMDTEGHLSLFRTPQGCYNNRIGITNSFRPVLEAANYLYGGGIAPVGNKKGKPCSVWYISNRKTIESCLLQTLPYLVAKRSQALCMLDFVRAENREKQDIAYGKMIESKIQSELTSDRKSVLSETAAT